MASALALVGGEGSRGRALGLRFSFGGGGGYAVARGVSLKLPENYAFRFQVRGPAPSNHLEFKLIDASGENVWWSVKRDFQFPAEWERITIKKRHIQFAWGPMGGGEIRDVAAIEVVVTAGSGGAGTVWIDDLELVELPPPDSVPPGPRVSASSELRDHAAKLALDRDSTTAWRPAASDTAAWIALDFGGPREYGGLVLDWAGETPASNYAVEASDDGRTWRLLYTVRGGNGGRDYIYLPEAESSRVRVRLSGSKDPPPRSSRSRCNRSLGRPPARPSSRPSPATPAAEFIREEYPASRPIGPWSASTMTSARASSARTERSRPARTGSRSRPSSGSVRSS